MSNLCKQFYENLTVAYNDKSFVFNIVSQDLPQETPYFLIINESSYREIIYSKKVFRRLFNMIQSYPTDEIWQSYYVSIILFIITAENKTNFVRHREFFYQLYQGKNYSKEFLIKELRLTERLLHCNSNKINKSSSLWRWYKELFVLVLDRGCIEHLDLLIFNKSGESHFGNYYAWNCCRWLFDNLPTNGLKLELMNNTQKFCLSHLSDSSSWNAFTYMILRKCRVDPNMYNVSDCKRLIGKIGQYHVLESDKLVNNERIIETQDLEYYIDIFLSTIHRVRATQYIPFHYLIEILRNNDNKKKYLSGWLEEVQEFESKNGEILIKNGIYPCIDPELEKKDLIKYQKCKHFGYRKIVLMKLNY